MIGVLADSAQHAVVREFFELFKTPWEFCQSAGRYDVLLCNDCTPLTSVSSPLTIIYSGRALTFDHLQPATVDFAESSHRVLLPDGLRLPIYKSLVTFEQGDILYDDRSGQPSACALHEADGNMVVRIGYDLFEEIAFLLSNGQPEANAGFPAVELHISFLRHLILSQGLPLSEIPPVPKGHKFIACLTHDIDHGSIRKYIFDHTNFGFIYRALLGSLLDLVRGRKSLGVLLENWFVVLKLPLVYLGLARDFWSDFGSYTKLEGHGRSTFFVVPFARRAGLQHEHPAPAFRATKYCAEDVASQLRTLINSKNEIEVHGIDAWLNVEAACNELAELKHVTGENPVGVRMHWLYFDENSPKVLEEAGFEYDSTMGYNEAVGYRNGTMQVFKPFTATRLLELPLHVMDTALFSSGRQNLSSSDARKLVDQILDHAERFGGVVTLNWHDRSIAPERLWGDFYRDLLAELKSRGAWLANAGETVRWFRRRRAFSFDQRASPLTPFVTTCDGDRDLPELCIRTHTVPTRESNHSSIRAAASH